MKTAEDKNKVIIVESSEIIREGLIRILTSCFKEFDIINLDNFDDLQVYPEKRNSFLVILNPEIIKNCKFRVSDTLAEFRHAKIFGIITNFYHRECTSLFDDLIYINDSKETIINIIKKHVHKPTKKKFHREKLTNREFDVLRLLIKGYSNKQIAGELFISVHTVVTHRKNITDKLGIKSIAGLTIYGVINNIVNVDDYLD